LSDSQQIIKLC